MSEQSAIISNFMNKYPSLQESGVRSMKGMSIAKNSSNTFEEFLQNIKTANMKSTQMIDVANEDQVKELQKFYDNQPKVRKKNVSKSPVENSPNDIIKQDNDTVEDDTPVKLIPNNKTNSEVNKEQKIEVNSIDYEAIKKCVADGTCKGIESGLEPINKAILGISSLKDEISKMFNNNNKAIQKQFNEVKTMSNEKTVKNEQVLSKPVNASATVAKSEDRAVLALEAIKKCAVDGVCEGLASFKNDFKKDVSDMIMENIGRLPKSDSISSQVDEISSKLHDFRSAVKNARDKYEVQNIVSSKNNDSPLKGKKGNELSTEPKAEVLTKDNLEDILNNFMSKINEAKNTKAKRQDPNESFKSNIKPNVETKNIKKEDTESKEKDNKKIENGTVAKSIVKQFTKDDIKKMVLGILKEETKEPETKASPETKDKVNNEERSKKAKSPVESNVLYDLVYSNRR